MQIYCLNPECNYLNLDTHTYCQKCNSSLRLDDRYGAIKEIGRGGFAKTFLAIDYSNKNLSRCVIKQFLPSLQNPNHKNWQMFKEEVTRLKMLNSYVQIPQLIDFIKQENRYYIIQEFIDGENLEDELIKEGVFNEEIIIKLLKNVLAILKEVHLLNIIHRDIKPQNIIRRIDNQTFYLVDFGASKLLDKEDKCKTATVIGSAEYVAPEQARGKTVFASDLYSLGVTCIHLLTNRSSFDLIDLNNQWIWEEYLTKKISRDLKKILNKMISFSLNTRYQKVEEVIKDLDNLDKRKLRLSWQTLTTFGILGSIVLILINKLDLFPPVIPVDDSPPVIPIDNSTPVDESPTNVEKPINNIPSKSVEILEKEAMESLMLLTDIQDKYFSQNGKFLEKNLYLPFASGHLFRIQKLDDRHIAIIALATENNLRNFVVMIWGGKPDLPENREKTKNYKPKNDDWGVLASPNMSFSKVKTPQNTIRFNYCETEKPIAKFPNFSNVKLTDSLPLSYQELSCPEGYVYSLLFLEIMSKKTAEIPPAIIYDIDGENLRIKK
ncbi:serine/threonine-protein kinase [Geminocystis herdmanii]|uniref:serine/threonine-protein kinase n=1 Tax=Geminocystis herdmanii TaxID=669359 RepID=UPI00036D3269|nr:serine/threonine-protein kinase [Geminocystis herdmanii]